MMTSTMRNTCVRRKCCGPLGCAKSSLDQAVLHDNFRHNRASSLYRGLVLKYF